MNIFEQSPRSDRLLAVLRIVSGLLFITFGTMKLFGYPPSPVPLPPAMSQMWFAGVLETFGGLAIVLGLLTRPVAFLLSGEMAVAYFQAHAPQSFWPSLNNGVPAVLFCFLYLYFAFRGAGAWSVDRLMARTQTGAVRMDRTSTVEPRQRRPDAA